MTEPEEAEDDERLFKSELPWAYDALGRIPRLSEGLGALFQSREIHWEEDDNVTLSDKLLIALLQLEIEDLGEKVNGLKEPREWRLVLRTKNDIMYQSPTGQVAKMPIDLADVITSGVPFEGEIEADGPDFVFSVGEDVVATVPRSLVLQLRGPLTEPDAKEGGTGGPRAGRGRKG